jgi:ABC-type glycerol-3-phosphate transport system permease component
MATSEVADGQVTVVQRQTTWPLWRRRLGKAALTLGLLAFTLVVIIPFIWMIILSLRTSMGILTNPYGLPNPPRWGNYVKLMVEPRIRFYRYFVNSTFVSVFALAVNSAIALLAGYGFGRSRYYFKGRTILYTVLLFALMLPPQIMYIPQFTMMSRYGLLNTRWSLVLLYAARQLPVSTYLMATYFSQLPGELEDAARIDGCTDFGTFRRVMLPLARPALATVILLNFMFFWNELLLAVTMVTNPNLRTLPAAMMMFVGEHGSDYAMAATSLVTSAAPIVVLYLFLSERFIEGMTAGAVKG